MSHVVQRRHPVGGLLPPVAVSCNPQSKKCKKRSIRFTSPRSSTLSSWTAYILCTAQHRWDGGSSRSESNPSLAIKYDTPKISKVPECSRVLLSAPQCSPVLPECFPALPECSRVIPSDPQCSQCDLECSPVLPGVPSAPECSQSAPSAPKCSQSALECSLVLQSASECSSAPECSPIDPEFSLVLPEVSKYRVGIRQCI